jgi:hypothetical protein
MKHISLFLFLSTSVVVAVSNIPQDVSVTSPSLLLVHEGFQEQFSMYTTFHLYCENPIQPKTGIRNRATAARGEIRLWFPWRNVTWTEDKVGYRSRIDRSIWKQLQKMWFPRSNDLIRTKKTSRRFKKSCSLSPGVLPPLHMFTYTRPRRNASPSNACIKQVCISSSDVFSRTVYIKNSTTASHCYCRVCPW